MNGMTYSPLGFGNWIPVVIAGKRPKSGQDCIEFAILPNQKCEDHPSPKPIQCIRKLINRLSNPNDLILDPFLGSGTTAVAAIETGRRWIGIEISEGYCDIAVKRIELAYEKKNQLELAI